MIALCGVLGIVIGRAAHRDRDEAAALPRAATALAEPADVSRPSASASETSSLSSRRVVPVPGSSAAAAPRAASALSLSELQPGETALGHGELLRRCAWLHMQEHALPLVATAEESAEAELHLAELDESPEVQALREKCPAFSAEQRQQAGDWLRRAALDGDADAMLCYASSPGDFYVGMLSPHWLRDMQQWNTEAPLMAERALAAGLAEGAALLARMNDGTELESPYQVTRGLIGNQPERAYVYARLYADHAQAGGRQSAAQRALPRYAARVDASRLPVLDEQARSLAAHIQFKTDTPSPRKTPLYGCDALRIAVGLNP